MGLSAGMTWDAPFLVDLIFCRSSSERRIEESFVNGLEMPVTGMDGDKPSGKNAMLVTAIQIHDLWTCMLVTAMSKCF
jgi:hypothetical protein